MAETKIRNIKRSAILRELKAPEDEIQQLLEYNANKFNLPDEFDPESLPLADEPFVEIWQNYFEESKEQGVFSTLKKKLVQLNFPVKKDISQKEYYRAVTLKGEDLTGISEATGLDLEKPDHIELDIHETAAGKLPMIIVRNRYDFVSILRALTCKNEPRPIPESMGACMIAGYNNWDRIKKYKQDWHAKNKSGDWDIEFKNLIRQKDHYQDRFVLVSDGPYSGVPAANLGLNKQKWKEYSVKIRQEHESVHYFTKRIFNIMQNNLLDELLADCVGIINATGNYNAKWFLHFAGLENYPAYREGGRFQNYIPDTISELSKNILMTLVVKAAQNLEEFLKFFFSKKADSFQTRNQLILQLSQFTLEELAADNITRTT